LICAAAHRVHARTADQVEDLGAELFVVEAHRPRRHLVGLPHEAVHGHIHLQYQRSHAGTDWPGCSESSDAEPFDRTRWLQPAALIGGMTQASDRLMGRRDVSASLCGQAFAAPEATSRSFWISLHRWGCQAGAVVFPIALATLIMCSVKS